MTINPYIVAQLASAKQERDISLASRHLEVEAIYHPTKQADFTEIETYCKTHRISFSCRPYSSDVFWEDRENIERLPAFHIYFKTEYEKTVYPEDDIPHALEKILNPKPSKWSFWKRKVKTH